MERCYLVILFIKYIVQILYKKGLLIIIDLENVTVTTCTKLIGFLLKGFYLVTKRGKKNQPYLKYLVHEAYLDNEISLEDKFR